MIITRQRLTSMTCGLLAIGALITASAAMSAEPSWELLQEEDGLNIYSRTVDGSSYNEIKATVLINAPITHVAKFVGDGNGCAKWRMKCKSSEVIETVSKDERYMHTVLDLPWPFTDRDFVLHSKTEMDTQTKTTKVSLNSSPSSLPAGEYVRAKTHGGIMIRAISEQLVEFTYIVHAELGGNLPVGRVNNELADSVYEDLTRLRELAEG